MGKTLVLGGGGPVGIAWEAGVAAGLAEAGVRIADADRIIGTSAGAFVGAQLASGRDPQNFAEAQIAQGEKDNAVQAAGDKPAGVSTPGDLTSLIQLMMTPLEAGETRQVRMAKFGALALAAKLDLDEAGYLAGFGRAFQRDWPERFVCTAIDAETGAFVIWDRSSHIELLRGVASSCAVPGIFPPVSINGARFIDGGVRSPTNIDLAKGADKVLALAVVGEVGREMQMARIGPELQALGSTPHRLITPDAGSLAAFGPNLMDPARRADICRAGLEQGRREAEALKGFWS
jgi:NTE family protein